MKKLQIKIETGTFRKLTSITSGLQARKEIF